MLLRRTSQPCGRPSPAWHKRRKPRAAPPPWINAAPTPCAMCSPRSWTAAGSTAPSYPPNTAADRTSKYSSPPTSSRPPVTAPLRVLGRGARPASQSRTGTRPSAARIPPVRVGAALRGQPTRPDQPRVASATSPGTGRSPPPKRCNSPPKDCGGGWSATRCPGGSWTTAAPGTNPPTRSNSSSSPATDAANTPAAPCPPGARRSTMSAPTPRAPPTKRTWSHCAFTTTARKTAAGSPCASIPTAPAPGPHLWGGPSPSRPTRSSTPTPPPLPAAVPHPAPAAPKLAEPEPPF